MKPKKIYFELKAEQLHEDFNDKYISVLCARIQEVLEKHIAGEDVKNFKCEIGSYFGILDDE